MGGFVEDGLLDGYSLRKIKVNCGYMLGTKGKMKVTQFPKLHLMDSDK